MREIHSAIQRWSKQGQKIALATVVKTWGSSPRSVGAKMAVNQDGEMVGSVSGGCVEGVVVSACLEALKTGKPKLLHFDVADETAMTVGLACGGELDVFVSIPSPAFLNAFYQAFLTEQTLIHITLINGDRIGREIIINQDGSILGNISEEIDQEINNLRHDQSQSLTLSSDNTLFIDSIKPPPKLIIVGGVHIAVALSKIAKASGYRVILVDPRRQFGTKTRFPEADQILHLWPDKAFQQIPLNKNTAIAFLTHDPKIDDPGLISALSSKAFYIGALGGQKTQDSRRKRLISSGVPEEQLRQIHAPIGLKLGGRSPEEISVAIMAEIIQTRNR